MPTRPMARPRAPERLLTALAVAWLAAVALIIVTGAELTPAEVAASPDTIAAGDLWRLLTSALIVASGLPLLQVALVGAATVVVLARHGAIVWWIAALVGHVGSTLIAYAIIAVAVALGSGSAERATDDWDYGISCVLAALAGVLFAGSVRRLRAGPRDRDDVALLAVTSVGLLVWIATIGWFGIEHPIAFALGAAILVTRASG